MLRGVEGWGPQRRHSVFSASRDGRHTGLVVGLDRDAGGCHAVERLYSQNTIRFQMHLPAGAALSLPTSTALLPEGISVALHCQLGAWMSIMGFVACALVSTMRLGIHSRPLPLCHTANITPSMEFFRPAVSIDWRW
jgi:hypothetical protein